MILLSVSINNYLVREQQVKVAVAEGKFQNDLYRTLEARDHDRKSQINKKLNDGDEKVSQNRSMIMDKHDKKHEKYNKHVDKVYKKFIEQQKHLKDKKDEKAFQLR